ncbi:5-oxoprolinase subunit B family protein [Nocardioides ferulae]|uniref:5-oxoprolinase subunit B family protein n=1 Tax=Nocardioides ferulae TaxID=2340821 RepID=UPI000EB2D7AE|nr:allophanate hydrolase subunit 1 [Nocardioides ferulae]
MHVHSVGSDSLLVEVPDTTAALSLAAWARERALGAAEIVPAATSVLFAEVADPQALAAALDAWRGDPVPIGGGVVELPVTYDGVDLELVAGLWGTTVEGAVARHTGIEFVSAFCGFAPGFSYLAGLPEELAVPRLDSPRARLRAGAVALAGTWCGIYPGESPGGWRVLGHTDEQLWDPERIEPALLPPGTRVRFRDVTASEPVSAPVAAGRPGSRGIAGEPAPPGPRTPRRRWFR